MLAQKPKSRGTGKSGLEGLENSPIELIESIKAGFPCRVLRDFQKETGLTMEQIAAWTGINPRTLARRLSKGKLTSDESDRVWRVKRLWGLAVELFNDRPQAAGQWLASPLRLYGGLTPIELSTTDAGAHELEAIILRLEDGVF